ncbi:MAG: 3'-5' exonuclease [Flavobacteriales bacterium]
MNLNNILFLDIETVPQHPTMKKAPDEYQKLWSEKAQYLLREEDDTVESVFDRAGIYAEFGRIVCISVGYINERGSGRELRIKSFYGDDEKILLQEFAEMLKKYFNSKDHLLCGHNGKEFDFPYIARRMLINGIAIPQILDISGKKPWEVAHLDTMQMWKFGDYKNFTSLKLLAHVFGLPTPKDDIDGSQVAGVYWKEKNLERIVRYCEKDVVTLVQVYLKLTQQPVLKESEINAGE